MAAGSGPTRWANVFSSRTHAVIVDHLQHDRDERRTRANDPSGPLVWGARPKGISSTALAWTPRECERYGGFQCQMPSRSHVRRVLPFEPYATLDEYVAAGGGEGLTAARAVASDVIIEELAASGLRGRGGAGFPTGEKWRTIKSFASPLLRTSVVVNAAEGEPGTFKDRVIIRDNPYAVIEGALIAARAMDATDDRDRHEGSVRRRGRTAACGDRRSRRPRAGCDGVEIRVLEGPSEYLYGEETALLEVVDDRPPFPRIAPPFRRGVVEVVETDSDVDSGSGLSADVQMAGTEDDSAAPPVLVEQRRDDGQRRGDHRQGRRLVPIDRHRGVAWHDRVHGHRCGAASRRRSKWRWARRCERSSRAPEACRDGPDACARCWSVCRARCVTPAQLDTAVELRGDGRRRVAVSAPRGSS